MDVLMIIGGAISVIGAIFLLLGAIGIVRMPDPYNRIQAGTKATTLGTMLFLSGVAVAHPAWLPKLLVLILFIIFTNPVSSHVLARAAHHIGTKMTPLTGADKLVEDPDGDAPDGVDPQGAAGPIAEAAVASSEATGEEVTHG